MKRLIYVTALPVLAAFVLAGCAGTGAMHDTSAASGKSMSGESMSGMEEKSDMGETAMGGAEAHFTVRVEVLSGSKTPLAPVAWAVYGGENPLFREGTRTRIEGLESLAEDGNPAGVAASLEALPSVAESGVTDTPDGAMNAGPAGPGSAYSFSFTATEGERLTFATMYVQSNDLFYSAGARGIELFRDGQPVSGDLTSRVVLYDAGTEVNEEPGAGANQAPRQSAPDTGRAENQPVQPISEVHDMYLYPGVNRVLRVVVSAM